MTRHKNMYKGCQDDGMDLRRRSRISIEFLGSFALHRCWTFVPSGAHDDWGDKELIEGWRWPLFKSLFDIGPAVNKKDENSAICVG